MLSCGTLMASVRNSVRTVLVVEDEEPIRMFLSEVLRDYEYVVLEAGTVEQAKRVLADTPVHLVFSDINMPGIENGFVLEKWVRQNYPETKVLLTSGFPHGDKDTKDLLEPIMLKPYTCSAIVRRIEDLFSAEAVADRSNAG